MTAGVDPILDRSTNNVNILPDTSWLIIIEIKLTNMESDSIIIPK